MYKKLGQGLELIKYEQIGKADLGEFLNLSSELRLKKFGVGIEINIPREEYKMSVVGKNSLHDDEGLRYVETLEPRRSLELSRVMEFGDQPLALCNWEENPKMRVLNDYMYSAIDEIERGMPYKVDMYTYPPTFIGNL